MYLYIIKNVVPIDSPNIIWLALCTPKYILDIGIITQRITKIIAHGLNRQYPMLSEMIG